MYKTDNIQIITRRQTADRLGCSLSSVDRKTRAGTLPPMIKVPGGSVGFVKQEIDLLLKAAIQGKSDAALITLIQNICEFRKSFDLEFVA